ncbi:MAG TPA: M14 family metallopeptidase [Ilumatobacteraceae bacterium]
MSSPDITPLSATYAGARAAFLTAAVSAGASISHHVHPLRGPDDEELAVDVAELGPPTAAHVVVVVSATHGVEGYCGSALQRHWLEHHSHERPADVALVMVHGLNPYGFAWVRRVNEDNVDLNRNFIDWEQPPPANPDYDSIADLIVPAAWSEEEQARTLSALFEVAGRVGLDRMQEIISSGQYTNPTGVFYGGTAPVWSHRWLRAWGAERLARATHVTIIDLHTGLGPWGFGELIGSEASTTDAHRRAMALWGDVTSMVDGDSVSANLFGDWQAAAGQLAPHAEVTATTIEYGTVDTLTVLQALRADAWLHAHGDPRGAGAAAVRAQVRAAFADDDPAWLRATWPRFTDVLDRALRATTNIAASSTTGDQP